MNLSNTSIATVLQIIKIIATAKASDRDLDLREFGSVAVPGHSGIVFKCDIYAHGFKPAITMLHKSTDAGGTWFMPFASLSVNVVDHGLPPGAFFAKCYGENTFLRYPLLSQGWFQDTGDRVSVGVTHVEVWKPTQKFCEAFMAAHQAEIKFLTDNALV